MSEDTYNFRPARDDEDMACYQASILMKQGIAVRVRYVYKDGKLSVSVVTSEPEKK